MREVMRELGERYDLVLYDTPAMGAVSDAFALVSESSGVIVVSRLGAHAPRPGARAAQAAGAAAGPCPRSGRELRRPAEGRGLSLLRSLTSAAGDHGRASGGKRR